MQAQHVGEAQLLHPKLTEGRWAPLGNSPNDRTAVEDPSQLVSPEPLPSSYSAAAAAGAAVTPSSRFLPARDCAMSSPEEEEAGLGNVWNTELPTAPPLEPAMSGGLQLTAELGDDLMDLDAVLVSNCSTLSLQLLLNAGVIGGIASCNCRLI